jgi:Tol biopolymer transport system component
MRLAYLEYDQRFVAATPPPVPQGAFAPPPAPAQGQASASGSPWTLIVVDVAEDGSIGGPIARVTLDTALSSCAEWSPDGKHLAHFASPQGPQQLWLVGPDGTSVPLGPAVNLVDATNYRTVASAFAWSPDGQTIAVLGDRAVLLIPTDGGPSRTLVDGGYQVVEWSPDGTTLALVSGGMIDLVGSDGAAVAPSIGGSPDRDPLTVAWSRDGNSILAFDGGLAAYDRDGQPVDAPTVLLPESVAGRAATIAGLSPDGTRLLLTVSGPDADGTLLTVDPRGSGQVTATELFPPTFAYRDSADWQPDFP